MAAKKTQTKDKKAKTKMCSGKRPAPGGDMAEAMEREHGKMWDFNKEHLSKAVPKGNAKFLGMLPEK